MPKRSRLEMKKPVATLDDLHSSWQVRWLKKELLLWRFLPGEFERLRTAPYPLDPSTADLIEYLGAEYVLPWPVAQVEFDRWLYPVFRERAVQTVAEFNDLSCQQAEDQFASLDLVEQLGLWPVVDALPGDLASEFAEECVEYEQALRASLEGTGLLCKCVRMPYLPLGGTLLSFLPLIDGEWIDLEALALCEACGSLTRAGYVRLESDDPHRLAWHRYYLPGTWWNNPRPCSRDVFLRAAEEARQSLKGCPARQQELAGRPHVHFGEYAAWEGRGTPGDLGAGLFRGLWLEGWNAWVSEQAAGQHGLAGLPVGLLPHPWRFASGKDFESCKSLEDAESALGRRAGRLAEAFAAAKVEAGKEALARADAASAPAAWPLSDDQKQILRALEGRSRSDLDLAGDLDIGIRTLYREIADLQGLGLVARDRSLGGYYRPDRPPLPEGDPRS